MKLYILSKHFKPALAMFLLSTFIVSLMAGCAMTKKEKPQEPDVLLWPAPPALPRFEYVTSLRYSTDIVNETPAKRAAREFTGEGLKPLPAFSKPYGVAANKGKVYVTNTLGSSVSVFDVPRSKFYSFGYREPPGQLIKPNGISLDDGMNVYVVDTATNEVKMFDVFGLYIRTFGNKADLDRPTGIAVNAAGTRIYVVDRGQNENNNHRVVVYDQTGKKLFVIGERGTEPGKFNIPVQAAVAPDGTLYVLDAGNFRIQAFDPNGKYLRSWGKTGNYIGDLVRPRGIAVDKNGNVYVTDAAFANVQIFNSQGELLLVVGTRGTEDRPGKFSLPSGVWVDEKGTMFVVDQLFNKVEVYRALTQAEGELIVKKAASKK